jgi:hypothetical protein
MTHSYHQQIIEAVEDFNVPVFSFTGIEQKARPGRAIRATKRKLLLTALLIAMPCLAVAATVGSSHALWQQIGGLLGQHHIRVIWNGAEDVATPIGARDATRGAAFHLIFPTGLPAGARLTDVEQQGADRTTYTATYHLAAGRAVTFVLQKKQRGRAYVPWIGAEHRSHDGALRPTLSPLQIWFVGDEVVSVPVGRMSPSQLDAVRSSMGAREIPSHGRLVVVH